MAAPVAVVDTASIEKEIEALWGKRPRGMNGSKMTPEIQQWQKDYSQVYSKFPLDYVKRSDWFFYAVAQCKMEDIQRALLEGINVNARRYTGAPYITGAFEEGCILSAQLLVEKGAKIDSAYLGLPAAFYARLKALPILKFLKEKGVDLNEMSDEGETALHHCVQSADQYLLKDLIGSGALLDVKNRDEVTPLLLALQLHKKDLDNHVEGMGIIGYDSIATILKDAGAKQTIPDKSGMTAEKFAKQHKIRF